jgi:D-beta-D-heptose 7-phosphate kinase/D-beta-D-heptose 1-phosphate adenosyltransferase
MKIIVIGESCKDVFVYGDCNRLSPEAPVPVIIPKVIKDNLGMSGNVVKNLEALDSNIEIVHWHQEELITKTRYVDKKSNHMFLRVDEGENSISEFKLDEWKTNEIKDADAIIISDYDKGFLSDKILETITWDAKFSIIDSKRKMGSNLITCFNFIKLNESEFLKCNVNPHHLKKILVTLGSKGAKHKDIIYPSPDPKETIDVSGAGDTFTASFTLKYLETNDVSKSIIFANKMASIVVSKRGVATP